jgi:hypothetical protein
MDWLGISSKLLTSSDSPNERSKSARVANHLLEEVANKASTMALSLTKTTSTAMGLFWLASTVAVITQLFQSGAAGLGSMTEETMDVTADMAPHPDSKLKAKQTTQARSKKRPHQGPLL